jgi:DNA-binding Lrp family transcriptional regulator
MLDAKDRSILALFVEDGRRSVVDIANLLDVPRATVQERMQRMLRSGTIRKFVAIPDYSKLGEGVTAYVLVSFTNDENVSQDVLADQVSRIPGVFQVSLISGEWDILLKVRGSSVEQVGKLVVEKLRMMNGIEKTQTFFSFKEVKEGF